MIGIPALSKWLGVTERHIRRLVPERRTPFYKVGGRIRFDPAEIVSWLENGCHHSDSTEAGDCRRPAAVRSA
jgi:excisionase family DNA binding protein